MTVGDPSAEAQPRAADPSTEVDGPYAKYVLGVLVIVYVFNFIDRQILSILAEDIKADLGITDAQIGFLYGTAFAVFYAVFGIPLGRLADTWHRTRLIAIGLAFWSAMTAASGFAKNFAMLATFRFGVGIGEASASPAANSLLADYFSPKVRATVLSIYSSGIYIGSGIGLFIGGVVLDGWNNAWPDPSLAPLGLKGWQAAFLIVGLPGIAIAYWVSTLKEPQRGQSEGHITPPHPHPFRETLNEFIAVLPPFTLYGLYQAKADRDAFALNITVLAMLCLMAVLLTRWVGEPIQWIALTIGIYGAFSWSQSLALRDPATFRLIFGSKTFIFSVLGFPSIAFVTYGLGFWTVPYIIRVYGADADEVGLFIGLGSAIGGWIGVTMGGVIADRLQTRFSGARHMMGIFAASAALPVGIAFVLVDSIVAAYFLAFLFSALAPMWVGPSYSAVVDLVLPRMRAIAVALIIFMSTFVGLAMGPFTIGKVSDYLASTGLESGEALRYGLMSAHVMLLAAVVFLFLAWRFLDRDMETKLDRARAAGEEI